MFQHSINPENPTGKNTRRILAVAGGVLGIMFMTTGCTSQGVEEEPAPEVTEQISAGQDKYAPLISTEYYPNGTRNVYIDQESDNYRDVAITGYCEGGDLIEVAVTYRGVGEVRIVGHVACADNRLTQEDFLPLPQ